MTEESINSSAQNFLGKIHGGQKRKETERNGDSDTSNMYHGDYECDCDACLLGFDDTRPGEVLENGPPVKKNPVNVNSDISFSIHFSC